MSSDYDRCGGYPLKSETLSTRSGAADIRLVVDYRFPYQEETADSTMLNITVKVIIARETWPGSGQID